MIKSALKDKNIAVCILASGSKGNSIFVSSQTTSILIDAGLSGKETEKRLKLNNIDTKHIDAILVTHEHSDHISGVGILCRRLKVPLYISYETYKQCEHKLGKIEKVEYFDSSLGFEIKDLNITPFSTSHDAVDPVGFSITQNNSKISIATDLGIVTTLVKESLKESNLVIVEANYDIKMLEDGPYEWHLKQRIKHRNGHLSNIDAKNLITEIMHPNLNHIILSHLSEENNLPEKALKEVKNCLKDNGVNIQVANQYYPSDIFCV